MRLLSINNCKPGMKLAKRIYNEHGLILLNENVELTTNLLTRLEQGGVEHLYIHDPRTEDIIIEEPISDETRIQAMAEIRKNFKSLLDDNTISKRGMPNQYIGRDFRNVLKMIIDDLSDHENAMMMLTTISVVDHYLYQHSLNVCIYSTMLGMASGYTQDELNVLGLGALLHDVGKTKISLDLLNKPGKLTDAEFDEVKKHPEIGYKILKETPNVPLISAHCAFQHHERIDGSGYPRQIAGDEIHEYAKWIGIADVYDAMTTHRTYRKAMLPHEAMEIMFAGSGSLFETNKLVTFRDRIALYPLGVMVQIDTGEKGVVVDINSSAPQRPVIRILQDEAGQDLTQPYEIDLSKKLNVMIVKVNDQDV